MRINNKKINSVKTMLTTYFLGSDIASQKRLEDNVEPDIIAVAKEEYLIVGNYWEDGSVYYRITPKGKQERDK